MKNSWMERLAALLLVGSLIVTPAIASDRQVSGSSLEENPSVEEPVEPERSPEDPEWIRPESEADIRTVIAREGDGSLPANFGWMEAPRVEDVPDCPARGFWDVPQNAWYHTAVDYCVDQGLFKGTSSYTFEPDTKLTRAMIVEVLYRHAGSPAVEAEEPFSDVARNQWYAKSVSWAKEHDIARGMPDGTFRPDDAVTRQDMVVFFYRYAQLSGENVSGQADLSAFPDWEQLADYAWAAMAWGVDRGLINGSVTQAGVVLDPLSSGTRAQTAKILMVYCGEDGSGYVHDPIPEELPEDGLLLGSELRRAAQTYHIDPDSRSYQALLAINTRYTDKISDAEAAGTLLFLFEGAGATEDPALRKNCLCVLVRNRNIIYVNRNCTTLPDRPFEPSWNDGDPMPTLKSGIYDFATCRHYTSLSDYGALTVEDAKVVRHASRTSYWSSTSDGINIHRRKRETVALDTDPWVSSAGCLLIGNTGEAPTDDYATFTSTVGIVDPGSDGNAAYQYRVNGRVIVDRSLAGDYLRAVGYTQGAIDLLG